MVEASNMRQSTSLSEAIPFAPSDYAAFLQLRGLSSDVKIDDSQMIFAGFQESDHVRIVPEGSSILQTSVIPTRGSAL